MIKKEILFENWEGWQVGYFVATYSADARKNLIRYITNQEVHHGELPDGDLENESYRDELIRLLELHNIEWDEKYLD